MSVTFNATNETVHPVKKELSNSDILHVRWQEWFDQKLLAYELSHITLFDQVKTNSFIYAINLAYDGHYPLTLSPDMIWLLISQGIAQHCDINTEEARKFFVDFEGKKELIVQRNDFRRNGENPWPEVFSEFIEKMQREIGKERVQDFIPKFSTTKDLEQTCFNLALMDIMKNYFDYTLQTLCALTQITLEGEKADWVILKEKAKNLRKYDLGWWAERLEFALQPFIDVFDGKVSSEFWGEFYKCSGGSGGPFIQGHILNFFPYVDGHRNELNRRCCSDDLPSGISQIPMRWEYYSQVYNMTLFSGFLGMTYSKGSIIPCIGWAVGEKIKRTLEGWIKYVLDKCYEKTRGKDSLINYLTKGDENCPSFPKDEIEDTIESLINAGVLSESRSRDQKRIKLLGKFDLSYRDDEDDEVYN